MYAGHAKHIPLIVISINNFHPQAVVEAETGGVEREPGCGKRKASALTHLMCGCVCVCVCVCVLPDSPFGLRLRILLASPFGLRLFASSASFLPVRLD